MKKEAAEDKMKKLMTICLVSLVSLACLVSCGDGREGKALKEEKLKADKAVQLADSLKEKKDVDSLFDVVGKNLDSAKSSKSSKSAKFK